MGARPHECYMWAYRLMENPDWTLVHGTILGGIVDHAWCEKGNRMYDPLTNQEGPASVFSKQHNYQVDHLYDVDTAMEEAQRTKVYGAWRASALVLQLVRQSRPDWDGIYKYR